MRIGREARKFLHSDRRQLFSISLSAKWAQIYTLNKTKWKVFKTQYHIEGGVLVQFKTKLDGIAPLLADPPDASYRFWVTKSLKKVLKKLTSLKLVLNIVNLLKKILKKLKSFKKLKFNRSFTLKVLKKHQKSTQKHN